MVVCGVSDGASLEVTLIVWKLNPVLEQLHSQQLPITHANYSQRRLNNGAKH